MSVCERESERVRERVCVRERERWCLCVREREREREREQGDRVTVLRTAALSVTYQTREVTRCSLLPVVFVGIKLPEF